MAQQFEIYKCELCGNIVEVLHAGDGPLACCGKPMKLMAIRVTSSEMGIDEPTIKEARQSPKKMKSTIIESRTA